MRMFLKISNKNSKKFEEANLNKAKVFYWWLVVPLLSLFFVFGSEISSAATNGVLSAENTPLANLFLPGKIERGNHPSLFSNRRTDNGIYRAVHENSSHNYGTPSADRAVFG